MTDDKTDEKNPEMEKLNKTIGKLMKENQLLKTSLQDIYNNFSIAYSNSERIMLTLKAQLEQK